MLSELERLQISISGRFEREIRRLLQRPFYFHLVATHTVELPEQAHPRDLYKALLNGLTQSFAERFGRPFDLEYVLSLAAYSAVEKGEEAQPVAAFLEVIDTQLRAAAIEDVHARDIANWLVSKSLLIPYTGARVAFFHQSVTEYLAADELCRRYKAQPSILKEKLSLMRWDQALFLTLSLLTPGEGELFIQTVVEADFALALNATKYLESDRDAIVKGLLSEVPNRVTGIDPLEHKIEHALMFGMAISAECEPELRTIIKGGNSIGAAAVKKLVELKGISIKEELLESLVEARDDYNYCCNGVGSALKPYATVSDVKKIAILAEIVEGETPQDAEDERTHGFICGAAQFLSELDLAAIRDGLMPQNESDPVTPIRAKLLCTILQEHRSTAALNFAGELLLRGIDQAATAMYFISKFTEPDHLSWASLNERHVGRLLSSLNGKNEDYGALEFLVLICEARPDLAEHVRASAGEKSGFAAAVMLHATSSANAEPFFKALGELTRMSPEERLAQPTYLLKDTELNWVGHEDLFIQLLKLRDIQLAAGLLAQVHPYYHLGECEIGPIDWWLEWSSELDEKSGYWIRYQTGLLFAKVLTGDTRRDCLAEFNSAKSKFRKVLASSILLARSDLTSDAFSEDAISFLLADLNREGSMYFDGHLLGSTATEKFVTERLLPLLKDAKGSLYINLRRVLKQAGTRHGRRYAAE